MSIGKLNAGGLNCEKKADKWSSKKVASLVSQIALTIQNCRRRKGLTQKDLAKKIGYSAGAVNDLESGHGNPTLRLLIKVAEHFDLAMSDLFLNSRPGVDRLNEEEIAQSKKIKVEWRTLQPMEEWEFEIERERQAILKIKNKTGYCEFSATGEMAKFIGARTCEGGWRLHDILNDQEFYKVPGGGHIKIKGIDEIPSEVLLIEIARDEGR